MRVGRGDRGTPLYLPQAVASTAAGAAPGRRDSFGVSGAETVDLQVADISDVFLVETVMIDDARVRQWEQEHGPDIRH